MMRVSFDQRKFPGLRLLAAGTALLLAAGCQSARQVFIDSVQEKEYFRPANFNGEPQLPASLHRVLLLPAFAGTVAPLETAEVMDGIFAAELQKQLRFEVVRVSRAECQRRFGAGEFASTAILPHDFLAALGRDFGAEAVMFVDLTSYRAYQPLALGVRAKLATVEQTRLIWTFDEVFSAEEPAVSNSVRHFYALAGGPAGVPLDPAYGALQSPSKFAAYVAAATFNTLPPR